MEIEVEENKWCSWCFEQGTHYLLEQKLLERNTYRCAYCCNDTKCCTLCGDGMSRCTPDGNDKLCMRCDGTIDKWGGYPEFVEPRGHCSWCFKDTVHLLIKYNYVRRSTYICSECKHRTLKCRTCDKDFARGSNSYDDESCYVCNGYVRDWSDPEVNKQRMTKKAWCSWCMENCDHVTDQVNTMRRDTFTCTKCEGRTLLCFTCKIAMTRGSGWDSDCCLVCSDKKNVLEKAGHGLISFKKNKAPDGSDTNLEDAWLQLSAYVHYTYLKTYLYRKKDAAIAKYDSPDYVRSELQRESAFRKKAIEAGVIRPFLLLVGMTPELRNQVSNFLGWSIITEPYFGDPHAESWDILSRSGSGMITRSNNTTQKLNPFAKSSTYYELLHKVTEAVFKFVPMPSLAHREAMQASNVSENTVKNSDAPVPPSEKAVHLNSSTNTFTTNKQVALDAEDHTPPQEGESRRDQQGEVVETESSKQEKEKLHATKNTLAIAQLEEFLMAQVHAQQRKTMTKAQRESEDKLTEDSQTAAFKTAVALIRSKAGLSNSQAIKYGVGVARQVFRVPGKWGLTLMSMQALQAALPTTAVFMGPAIAGLSVLMGPLAIIGLAQLLWSGVNMAIGPTFYSLYGPLVLMTNQRIVLALQDMQVEKFY